MATHDVTVWGKRYDITAHQKSKTVWIAVGTYLDEQLETQGRTESDAVRKWGAAARYRGG
jgi:hypothetical protein